MRVLPSNRVLGRGTRRDLHPLVHGHRNNTGIIDLSCPGEPGPCGTPSTYAIEYNLGLVHGQLHQGERSELSLYAGTYEARNLRSFFAGECDDDYSYAFYLRRLYDDS